MLPCPRREESGLQLTEPDTDHFRNDDTCSYCGSLNPDTFMAKVEASEITLGPTDKSYKVYVEGIANPMAGARRVVSSSNAPFHGALQVSELGPEDRAVVESAYPGPHRRADDHPPKYVTFGVESQTRFSKFYFKHLSVDQRKRFVELLNGKRLQLGEPGYFYVRPFFVQEVRPNA